MIVSKMNDIQLQDMCEKRTSMEVKIAACLSDWANLASEANQMVKCGADWLHLEIMDGHFVPNFTIGAPVVASLRKHTEAYLDCHLMVTNPIEHVEPLARAGASGFTFHVEASKDNWRQLIQSIKAKGMRPGVALKPETPVEEVYPLVEDRNPVDLVLIMTAEPGYSALMPKMMDKVRALRKKYPSLDIQVDGGLGHGNIELIAIAGANCVVAGVSVFLAVEPAKDLSYYRKIVEESQQIRGSAPNQIEENMKVQEKRQVEETTKVKKVVCTASPDLARRLAFAMERQKAQVVKSLGSQAAASSPRVAALEETIKFYKEASV